MEGLEDSLYRDFSRKSHALSLDGICADCQVKEKAKKEAQEG